MKPHALSLCSCVRLGALPLLALQLACSGAPPPKTVDAYETEAPPLDTEVAPPALPNLVQFDLDQIQGTWETKGVRAVKEITGKRETVTYYDANRRVRSRHTADLELLRGLDDTVRVIAWSNLQTLVGQAPPERSGAYVYNCDGQRLVEYGGSLGELGPRSAAYAVIWQRAGATATAPPAARSAAATSRPAAAGRAAQAPAAKAPAAAPPAGRADKLGAPAGGHALEGMASWQGPEQQGKPTASGEAFDAKALTGAHRTLPFGTRVKVQEVDGKRNVDVRINDRGPFEDDGVVVLSQAAAQTLGLIQRGRARVRLTVLP